MTDELSFGEKMRAAMADVSYLEKKGWNAHFKYAFVQEAEVKRAVSEAIRAHGLMISSVHYAPIGECSGKAATIACHLTIGDIKGSGTAHFEGIGSGSDSSDKAPMKAMAAALKYALTSGFLIATGDDPEEDGGSAVKESGNKTTPAPAKKSAPVSAGDPAGQDSHESGITEKSAVEVMTASVENCTTLEALNTLKIAVSKLRNEAGFETLADAFRAKGKTLTAASKEAVAA